MRYWGSYLPALKTSFSTLNKTLKQRKEGVRISDRKIPNDHGGEWGGQDRGEQYKPCRP